MSQALDLTAYYDAKAAKKEREPDLNFHVVIVGDPKCGKSAILDQLCYDKWRDLEAEALERAKREKTGKKSKGSGTVKRRADNWRWDAGALEVYWDPKGGCHWEENIDFDAFNRIEGNKLLRIRFLDCVDKYPTEMSRRAYYRGAQGALVVYAVDERRSYENALAKWLEEVEAYCWENGRGRYGDVAYGKPGYALGKITGYVQGFETMIAAMLVGNKKDREEDKTEEELNKESEVERREFEPITEWEIDIALSMNDTFETGERPMEQIDERIYPEEWGNRGDEGVAVITDSIFDQRHPERNSAILTEDDTLVGEWLLLQECVGRLRDSGWIRPPKEMRLPGHREVSKNEAEQVASMRGHLFYETSPKIDSDVNRNRTKNTVTGVYTVHSSVKEAANLLINKFMEAYQQNPEMYEKIEEQPAYDEHIAGETYPAGIENDFSENQTFTEAAY